MPRDVPADVPLSARPGRSGDMATAAGLSLVAAGVVGAFAAAGHAVHRDPGRPLPLIGRGSGRLEARAGRSGSGGTESRAASGSDDPTGKAQAATAPSPDASFKPEGPEDLTKPTFLYSLKKTAKEFGADQCTDIAASLVYYAVLALGPAILAIVSILGLFGPNTIRDIKRAIAPALEQSPGASGIVNGLIDNVSSTPGAPVAFIIGIATALFSASGYVGAFGRAMNRIYSVPEGRPVWKLRPTQLLVTLTVVVLVVIGALLLISTGSFIEPIANSIGVGPVALLVFQIAKWPVLVVLGIAGVAILYYFSPNIRQPKFKWTSTGSILALVVWAIATVAFGLYLSFTGGTSYSRSYGPIAGVIIFLLYLWITNLVLLFGAEFDAELERSRELQAGIAAEEQIQLPLRDTRQSEKKAAKHEKDVEQARNLRMSRGRED